MKTKTLCTLFGGSHLYNLNTPSSDLDYRGVFMNTDPAYILGTKRFDEERKQNASIQEDVVLKELNHFFALLKNANSEALEILFAPEESFTSLSSEMNEIRDNKNFFVDSEKLFNCLRGYMMGEKRLMLGERRGQIGGKRFEQVQKFGYSPKNYCQMIRLAFMGEQFFRTGNITVRLEGPLRDELLAVKMNPSLLNKDSALEHAEEAERMMIAAYEEKAFSSKFDEQLANELLLKFYMPYLR